MRSALSLKPHSELLGVEEFSHRNIFIGAEKEVEEFHNFLARTYRRRASVRFWGAGGGLIV